MLERFQNFFQTLVPPSATITLPTDDPRVAITALCLQVMEADGVVHDSEQRVIRDLLKSQYKLDDDELEELLHAGQKAESSAVDYYRFTADIKRYLDPEQRIELVGILWDIVYADGTRSELEDHVIWRIADLLDVSDRDRVLKRQEAASRVTDLKSDPGASDT